MAAVCATVGASTRAHLHPKMTPTRRRCGRIWAWIRSWLTRRNRSRPRAVRAAHLTERSPIRSPWRSPSADDEAPAKRAARKGVQVTLGRPEPLPGLSPDSSSERSTTGLFRNAEAGEPRGMTATSTTFPRSRGRQSLPTTSEPLPDRISASPALASAEAASAKLHDRDEHARTIRAGRPSGCPGAGPARTSRRGSVGTTTPG